MAIIKPVPNKPLTLSLQFPSAIEKQGKYGLQFLYTLTNGDLIYLPPIAHQEIQSLHPGPSEPFTLTKTIGEGNQAVWKVERCVRKNTESHADAHKRIYGNQPDGSEKNAPIPNRPASELNRNNIAPKSITNGKPPVAVMPLAAPSLTTPQSRAMVKQLFAAVDACKLTKDYAKTQGIEFEPTADIICRVAITAGIQVFREGAYT